MTRTWIALFGIVAAVAARPGIVQADDSSPIRIGVVAFDKLDAKHSRKDLNALGSDRPVALYLRALAANAKGAPAVPRFQLYRGNYYQVLQWMESGEIDGAVLSPFMAMLAMRRDSTSTGTSSHRQDTVALVNFAYSEESANGGGAEAKLWAVDHNQQEYRDPRSRYKQFIHFLVSVSLYADYERHEPRKIVVNLVSHLSTSGFILPLLYTHRLLHGELDNRKLPAAQRKLVARRFWDLYFQHVRLKLWHEKGAGDADTQFNFTYADADADSRGRYAESYGKIDRNGKVDGNNEFDPNDVLVLRTRAAHPNKTVSEWLQSDIPGTALQSAADAAEEQIRSEYDAQTTKPHWYRFIRRFDPKRQDDFEQQVRATFLAGDGDVCALPLKALWSRWYVDGKYDFMADEIINLLSHDQMIRSIESGPSSPSRSAALVLPGGGVRGAYQAALLDELYGDEKLVNMKDDKVNTEVKSQQGSLIVRHVVGTSGGALVGFFAAQRHAGRLMRDALVKDWIDGEQVVATPDKIFPPVGLLRWISALLALAVYGVIARMTLPRMNLGIVPGGKVPPLVWFGVGLAILLAPFVLWRFARLEPSYVPLREGLFYVLVLMLGHLIFTTTKSADATPLPARKGWTDLLAVLCGAAGLTAAFCVLFVFDEENVADFSKSWGISHLSLLGFLALVAILMAVYVYAAARGRIDYDAMVAYLAGLCALSAAMALTWAFFQGGRAIGATSSIEMTLEYWIWLLAAAIAAGAAITGVAHFFLPPTAKLYEAISFWHEPHTDRRLLSTPGQSLIAFGVTAIVLWIAFAASALYSSFYGFETFRQSAERFRMSNHRFLANFVATTTALGTSQLKQSPRYKGDYYVCMNEDDACTKLHDSRPERVFPLPPTDREHRFLDAVFASGSPFPIYPSRLLRVDTNNAGMFMDGGYAHNTPLEAARLLSTEQVLIVNSARRSDDMDGAPAEKTVSDLAVDSATLFPFLFDRSQMLDKSMRDSMFVASLSPYAGHEPEAFLMDFREATVKGLRDAAVDDFKRHRIGRVESWGQPARLLYDSGDPKGGL